MKKLVEILNYFFGFSRQNAQFKNFKFLAKVLELGMLGVSHTRYYEIPRYYGILVSRHYETLWDTGKVMIFSNF